MCVVIIDELAHIFYSYFITYKIVIIIKIHSYYIISIAHMVELLLVIDVSYVTYVTEWIKIKIKLN